MPLKLGVWKLEDRPTPVSFSRIDSEDRLEEALNDDISILEAGLIVVVRQMLTAYDARIDLLAMDAEGNLSVIELNRDRTPREVGAQVQTQRYGSTDSPTMTSPGSTKTSIQTHISRRPLPTVATARPTARPPKP
jgi:hypothetical protein